MRCRHRYTTSTERGLPDFPWDSLAPYAEKARAHPDGIVDLSVGTPVDATPEVIRRALADAADAPGYPLTAGSPALREAIAGWLQRRFAATVDPAAILPVIGTKELVAWLPTLLEAASVGYPSLAYPTYDVGARLAAAKGSVVDATVAVGPARLDLLWLNSPSNPTGKVLPPEHLRKVADWARDRGTVVASDECYADIYYGEELPVSVLSPEVCGGVHDGLLAVHSLSKRSNLAGYRAGFLAGDPALVAQLLEVRKHAGMIVPGPVQAAMIAALGDDEHVVAQRNRYQSRRAVLLAALRDAGFTVDDTGAGLYLWSTRDEDCWETVGWLAGRGILAAPGSFYGTAGTRHVRIALTATDERIAAAADRLVRA
ncbi:MAG TPA: succinyldiaminopimelate transaminase [Mycobacteriales bacterium]|nr:succinyldiaminopimelate transaminase [Mycobacteriales bacterium]